MEVFNKTFLAPRITASLSWSGVRNGLAGPCQNGPLQSRPELTRMPPDSTASLFIEIKGFIAVVVVDVEDCPIYACPLSDGT